MGQRGGLRGEEIQHPIRGDATGATRPRTPPSQRESAGREEALINIRRRLPDGTHAPTRLSSAWSAVALTAGTLGAWRQITPKPPPLWAVRTPEEAAEHWAASIGPNATPPVADSAPGISPVYGSWLYRKSTPKS